MKNPVVKQNSVTLHASITPKNKKSKLKKMELTISISTSAALNDLPAKVSNPDITTLKLPKQ